MEHQIDVSVSFSLSPSLYKIKHKKKMVWPKLWWFSNLKFCVGFKLLSVLLKKKKEDKWTYAWVFCGLIKKVKILEIIIKLKMYAHYDKVISFYAWKNVTEGAVFKSISTIVHILIPAHNPNTIDLFGHIFGYIPTRNYFIFLEHPTFIIIKWLSLCS